MYFPYLLIRTEEVEAIISSVCTLGDNKVIPILVPYSEDEDELYSYGKLCKVIENLVKSQKHFILLIDHENDLAFLRAKFPDLDSYCIHGYESHNGNYLSVNNGVKLAIIHSDQNHQVKDNPNILYHIFMPSVLRFGTYINKYSKDKAIFKSPGKAGGLPLDLLKMVS
jgi:hypothetical protein